MSDTTGMEGFSFNYLVNP